MRLCPKRCGRSTRPLAIMKSATGMSPQPSKQDRASKGISFSKHRLLFAYACKLAPPAIERFAQASMAGVLDDRTRTKPNQLVTRGMCVSSLGIAPFLTQQYRDYPVPRRCDLGYRWSFLHRSHPRAGHVIFIRQTLHPGLGISVVFSILQTI